MNPSIHFEIPRHKLWLRAAYLYDLNDHFDEMVEADLVEVTSYPGHIPTFTAIVECKYLFHYLPVQAFATTQSALSRSLAESNSFNCPSGDLVVYAHKYMDRVAVFNKEKTKIGFGKYLMTFDWYKDNDLCHLVSMDDGTLVLAPSHKLIVNGGTNDVLPSFKKLHQTWKIK